MVSAATVRRRLLVLFSLLALFVAIGWASPAAAAGKPYAEASMQVQKEGLSVEQHLRFQAELSKRLSRELPAGALESPVRVPVAPAEITAVDSGSLRESPLKIGLVKPLAQALAVQGLDGTGLGELPEKAAGGLAYQRPDGGVVWAAVVRAEEAGALRLHVQDFSLPQNAQLFVYSRSGEAFGPYTASGPDGTGDFWTTAVFGPEAILQVKVAGPVSAADLGAIFFRVAEAGLITWKFAGNLQGIFPTPFDRSAKAPWPCGNQSCILDATCTSGTPANTAKLAVAKMEWVQGAFIYTCTGGLISDNNPSQNNFFLTANHCLSKTNVAKNVSFYWRYATATCNGTCPINTAWPFKTTGSTVSASNVQGDFTLLHLNANPPAGSVFLGWTSAPVANTNGAHLYRISNPNFGTQVYSAHDVDTSVGTCTGWPRGRQIYSRDVAGAIDGGSSGSPVLNASSQIVGQLSGTCGFAPDEVCSSGPGESNATADGAFAFYFSSVQPFLNP